MIEATVEDAEKEERKEDHDDKVSNEDVISAIADVLPHLCWTDRQLTLWQDSCAGVVIFTDGWGGDLRVVCFVAGLQLGEPGDVPEEGGGQHRQDEEPAGISQGSANNYIYWILGLWN